MAPPMGPSEPDSPVIPFRVVLPACVELCREHFERLPHNLGVHGIQPNAAGAKERLVVADFLRTDLEHEVFHHQFSDVLLECDVIHCQF